MQSAVFFYELKNILVHSHSNLSEFYLLPMSELIKVLVVDDHALIREAWVSLLSTAPGIQVVGKTDNADDAYNLSIQYRPDVVLMDINLKGSNGFDAAERIYNGLPKTRIIGLTLHDEINYVKKFLSIGGKGYLTKNINREELIAAVHAVYNGETYIASEIKDRYFASLLHLDNEENKKELTLKEIEVIKLIATGMTSKEIADQLFLSPRTVETHRHNILKKLGFSNAAQLTGWANEKGYL
jgi:two-component system response regulator NreC